MGLKSQQLFPFFHFLHLCSSLFLSPICQIPFSRVSGSGSNIFSNCGSGSGSRDLMTKILQLKYFFDQKLHFTYTQAFRKDNQATGEAFSPQKRTSSTSKHNFFTFYIFVGHFCPPNPYSDPATQNYADPCGSGFLYIFC